MCSNFPSRDFQNVDEQVRKLIRCTLLLQLLLVSPTDLFKRFVANLLLFQLNGFQEVHKNLFMTSKENKLNF